jgi:hypothetical protein
VKNIVFRLTDHSVKIGMAAPSTLAAMVGSGGLIPVDAIEKTIAQHMVGVDNQEEFDAGWEAFLEARKGTDRELAVRAWAEGVSSGGLTEEEAYRRLYMKNLDDDCVGYELVEDDSMPDRYFRNAWVIR